MKGLAGLVVSAAIAFAVSSCGGSSPNTSASSNTPSPTSRLAALAAWFASVSTDYSAVTNDFGAVGAVGGTDLTGIISACQQLDTDVQKLQSDVPIPDAATNAIYQDALTNSAEFATQCVAAATDVSASELVTAEQYQTKALSDFNQINGILKTG